MRTQGNSRLRRARLALFAALLTVAALAPVALARQNPPAGAVQTGERLIFEVRADAIKDAAKDAYVDSSFSQKETAYGGGGLDLARFRTWWSIQPRSASVQHAALPSAATILEQNTGLPHEGKFELAFKQNASHGRGAFLVQFNVTGSCGAWAWFSKTYAFGPYTAGTSAAPAPVAASRASRDCGPVAGTRVVVAASTGCGIAAGVATGRVAGWTCRSPLHHADRIWICQGPSRAWAVALPPNGNAPGSCAAIVDDLKGSRKDWEWAVWRGSVDCRFAREQSLSVARGTIDHPPRSGPAQLWWQCVWLSRGSGLALVACQKDEPVGSRWFVLHPTA